MLCALVFAATVQAAPGARGTTARTCSPPAYPSTGYFTSLTVSGTNCATGRRVALAYFRCRVRGGDLKGVCWSPVLGFSCSEERNATATQIDARVTCRRGKAVVVHEYQQNL